MKKWFSTKSLFFKLMATGLVAILLMVVSSLLMNWFYFKNSDRANDIHLRVDNIMAEIQNSRLAVMHFIQRDLTRKAFYERGTSRYLEKHDALVASLQKDIADLIGLVKGQRKADIQSIRRLIDRYESVFRELVDAYRQRGFKDWGVLGEWRRAIHKVEHQISQLKNIRLLEDLLQLRRFEKDYLLRGESEYIRQHGILLERLHDEVAKNGGLKADAILRDLRAYAAAFNAYILLQQHIGRTDGEGLQRQFVNVIAALEPALERVYQDALTASQEARQAFVYTTLFIDALGLVLGAVVFYLFARAISLKLVQLRAAVSRVGQGNLNTKVTVESTDEIGMFTAAFNKMTEDLASITVSKVYVDKIIESMADSLIVVGSECDIKTVNRATLDLLDYSQADLLGKPLAVVLGAGMPGDAFTTELIHRELIRNVETSYRTRCGTLIPVLFSSSTMRDKGGRIMGIVCIAHDYRERKRTDEMLKQSEVKLRVLSSQILASQEQERKRVAMELHDGIGQSLTAIKFSVENSLEQMEKAGTGDLPSSLGNVVPMIQGTIEEVRKIAMDLRPSSLDDLGLAATITWFCRQFQLVYSGIRIEKQVTLTEDKLPENLKTTLFRILQETFNNVAKHSRADLIRLDLLQDERSLTLTIKDNGRGFEVSGGDPNPADRGLGLSGLQERAELSGGTLLIHSEKDRGTTVRAVWHLDQR